MKSFIHLDTDKIKKYVFATSTLKEIRGASAILDELNRKKMEKIIKQTDEQAECIYANGGSALFEVNSEKAEECIRKIEQLFHDETITGSVSCAAVTVDPENNFHAISKKLAYKLRLAKNMKSPFVDPVSLSFLRPCDSCGENYALNHKTGSNEDLLCKSCFFKRNKDLDIKKKISVVLKRKQKITEKHNTWMWLLSMLINSNDYPSENISRPNDFEEIGELSAKQGYMGLLYADGNGMGEQLSRLNSKNDLREFAKVVDEGVRYSVFNAIQKHLYPRNETLPFDILLLGGDDLVMVTVADKAMETALEIAKNFKEYSSKMWRNPLELSIGVAIAHVKFPFGNLLHLAEDLLTFAKKEAAVRSLTDKNFGKNQAMINFLVVNASNSLDFTDTFNKNLMNKDRETDDFYIRTMRPYDIESTEKLINVIKKLKSQSFPNNKLAALRESVFMDKLNSELTGLIIQNRLSRDHRVLIISTLDEFSAPENRLKLPWIESSKMRVTPFLDIAELYDFIK